MPLSHVHFRTTQFPGRRKQVKQKIVEMAMNRSDVRDTARVLGVSSTTVINELKKREQA